MTDKQLIKSILLEDQRACNDDTWLIARVWAARKGGDPGRYYELFRGVPDAQYIKRQRRLLHQQGVIKYNPEVEQKRFNEFKDHQAELSPNFKWIENLDEGGSVVMQKVEV